MATIVNARDVLLQSAPTRSVNLPTAQILLSPSAPAFHVTAAGANSPALITFTATLIDLVGTISFACTGAALSNQTANSVDVTYASLTGNTFTVTASVTSNGVTFNAPLTIAKVVDGTSSNGTPGSSVFVGVIYQQSSSQPATPTGGSFNFTNSTLTPPPGWTVLQPTASSTPTWAAAFSFSTATPGATVVAGTWAAPVVVTQLATNGINGLSTATVQLYYRNLTGSTPPPPNANVTYTFATSVASGLSNGWTQSLQDPSLGPFQFSILATASAAAGTATDIISPGEWSPVTRLVRDGLDGTGFYPPIEDASWSGGVVASVSDGVVGAKVRRCYLPPDYVASHAKPTPIDRTRSYRVRFWARSSADANGTMYADLQQFSDASGGTVGIPNGGRAYYSPSGVAPHTNWVEYDYLWDNSIWQASTTHVAPDMLLNYQGTAGYWEVQGWSMIDATEALRALTAAKADAADKANAAQAAAAADAQAKADLAKTTAQAYADGIVTTEEQRAINDATAKANAAHDNAVAAAAADATAKANVAATTATWAGVGGDGKPQNNATVGADASNLNVTIGGDNLAYNSSFEKMSNGSLADGYNVYNNDATNEPATASSAAGRTGGVAQQISWINSHLNNIGINGPMCKKGWLVNQTYVISVWAKTTNLSSPSNLFIAWNTQPASSTALSSPVLSTSWQRYSFRIVWGSSVEASGYGFISVANGAGAGNVIFDDLMVTEGDFAPSYYPSAAEAQGAADTANAAIVNISSDNVLSKGEKPQVILDYNTAAAETAPLHNQAVALGVDPTSYDNAFSALGTYLGNIGPGSEWQDSTKDSPIVGSTFRSKFSDYYTAKQALLNAMHAKAATLSTWGGTAGRPANLAGLGGTEAILNSGIYLNADGTLAGTSGGGRVTNLLVVDTRGTNPAPNAYAVCHLKEFRDCASIGLSTNATYCILETLKGWPDGSGANNIQAMQWAYVGASEVWKRSANSDATSWGAWVRDLDRNLFTGDLNATLGAPAGTNVGSTPATTVEANAAAGAAAQSSLNTKPSVTIDHSSIGNSYPASTTSFGNIRAVITNGTAPFTISWTLNDDASEMSHLKISSSNGTPVGLSYASGATINGSYGCNPVVTVTDANNYTCSANATIYFYTGVPQ